MKYLLQSQDTSSPQFWPFEAKKFSTPTPVYNSKQKEDDELVVHRGRASSLARTNLWWIA
jgi:hypothetical protein